MILCKPKFNFTATEITTNLTLIELNKIAREMNYLFITLIRDHLGSFYVQGKCGFRSLLSKSEFDHFFEVVE